MSDYGWFALKGICIIICIGLVCWLTTSGLPLFALMLMPSWTNDDKKKGD